LEEHKLSFNEEYSKSFNQSKQDKLQWLQNPSQTNGDNMNNIWCETCRTSRNKM